MPVGAASVKKWLGFGKPSSGFQNPSLLFSVPFLCYRFGFILLHSLTGGTMFSVTSSSRILHRCS